MNDHVHPIFADILKTFAPIPVGKVLPPHARTFIPVLEPARAQPCCVGADDVAEYAQTYRAAKPADPDDVFSQDEDAEEAEDVRELLSQRPAPTPNGKTFGLLQDALAALRAEEEWRGREAAGALDDEWNYEQMVGAKRKAVLASAARGMR